MLLWADIPSGDQGIYGTDTGLMTNGIWAQATNVVLGDDPDPNVSGRVLRFSPSAATPGTARYVLPATRTKVGMACRVWLNNIPISNARRPEIHQYRDGSNNILVSVCISPTGSIQVFRGERGSNLIAETTVPVLTANTHRHIESCIEFSASTGTVEVRVEGAVVIDEDNLNTGTGPCAQVAYVNRADGTSAHTVTHIKDLAIWDGSGTENNDFLGPCGVYWRPVADDISSGWARSAGSSDYELLDETPPDDDTYISADDSPPAPSIMGFDPLPPDIVAIRGIISVVRAQKTDGGDGTLQMSLSPDGTNWDTGTDHAVSTAFTYYTDPSEISPATTDPWTPIEFEDLELRINRTT